MPRSWISLPIGRTGIRIGRSIADSELRARLPNWRRYEIRKGLQAAASARGEPMSREDCDYIIDRALATGGLDSAGVPTIHVRGNARLDRQATNGSRRGVGAADDARAGRG